MGLLVKGRWVDQWYDTESTGGKFQRQDSAFRDHIGAGDHKYPVASGRYHLYVSWACPWAHRTLIFRKLKGLEQVISVSVVHPLMPAESWVFGDYPGATPDPILGLAPKQRRANRRLVRRVQIGKQQAHRHRLRPAIRG